MNGAIYRNGVPGRAQSPPSFPEEAEARKWEYHQHVPATPTTFLDLSSLNGALLEINKAHHPGTSWPRLEITQEGTLETSPHSGSLRGYSRKGLWENQRAPEPGTGEGLRLGLGLKLPS